MPLPSTGTAWKTSGLNAYKGSRVRRGGLVAALVRDYGGAATDLSPAAFSSPFALDGTLRTDLLATTASPNQGWYLVGALHKKGVDITPDIAVDNLEILQSNREIRSDITKEGGMVGFTALESTPLIDCLDYNLPLTSLQDIGTVGYLMSKAVDADLVERQLILIRSDKAVGNPELTAYGYPRLTLDKINKRTWDKTNPDALDISFRKLLDPFAVDANLVPAAEFKWREGSGWRAGGVFGNVAPVAVAVTGAKATVTFATPAGDPPVYTVTKTTGGTPSSAAILGSPAISGANTVITVQTLTVGTLYTFTVTATGHGIVATSLPSNAVTAIA